MPKRTLFTSESVCAGHPDKIADRISDAVLDEIMRQDPHGRAGVETVAGANRVAMHFESVAAVFEIVRYACDRVGQLAGLADRHETDPQPVGDRCPNDEAARLNPNDFVGP